MFQEIELIGNLGNDPEAKYTNNGTLYANFSIATSKKWKNAQGEQQTETLWFRVTAWDKKADLVSKYLKKGSKIRMTGEMRPTNPWIDKDSGLARCNLEVTLRDITFLGDSNRQQTEHRQYQPEPSDHGLDEDIPF